jgi:uncharacterized protein
MTPEFEFDEAKSRVNKEKHGIDFIEAQDLWLDESRIETPASFTSEPRSRVTGRIAGEHWSAIITYRGDPDSHDLRSAFPGRRGEAI